VPDSLTYLAAIPLMAPAMNTTPMTGEAEAIDPGLHDSILLEEDQLGPNIDLEYLT